MLTIEEAPDWIREFLEKKAPWWLKCELKITVIDENRRLAKVVKDGFTYTLIPEQWRIA